MTAKPTKYERIQTSLNEDPLATLRDTLCALHDPDKRLVRFCHPLWSLDVRVALDGKPEVVCPWSVPVEQRSAVLAALERALTEASEGEVTLLDFVTYLRQEPHGQDVLRCLLPLRVLRGHAKGKPNRDRSHLRLAV